MAIGFLVSNEIRVHLVPKVIIASDFPGKANLVEESYAFLRKFALFLEGTLILDPSAKLHVGGIPLRDVAVAVGLLEF